MTIKKLGRRLSRPRGLNLGNGAACAAGRLDAANPAAVTPATLVACKNLRRLKLGLLFSDIYLVTFQVGVAQRNSAYRQVVSEGVVEVKRISGVNCGLTPWNEAHKIA